jgi:hypothetical protein
MNKNIILFVKQGVIGLSAMVTSSVIGGIINKECLKHISPK